MDVSPKQLVSVAAGLIPFLEHDDANRALMGSNMQRQAVPLIVTEAPLVAPVWKSEWRAIPARSFSRRRAAKLLRSRQIKSSSRMTANCRKARRRLSTIPETAIHVYQMRKFMRSNAATCINQKTVVRKGQHVKKGQVIADGPCTDRANSRSAATCSSRSCRGTVTTSRTPS